MLFAKVVFGLAVSGPFDYIVPEDLEKRIRPGERVKVSFGFKKRIGYVAGLSQKTKIKSLKKILELIDDNPVLDKYMLSLAAMLSEHYCCSLGEAIETALPESLRRGKRLNELKCPDVLKSTGEQQPVLVHDLDGKGRWGVYLEHIKAALDENKSILILLPDIFAISEAKRIVESKFNAPVSVLYRQEPKELEEWARIKEGDSAIVMGTRSSIFAPLNNLGLIIIDDEQNGVYKQDQTPHYHARDIAFMRAKLEHAKLILGSISPSLETFLLVKKNKIKSTIIPRSMPAPEVKIFDIKWERSGPDKKKPIFSRYLEDCIGATINSGGKTLIFLNRLGFSTLASCLNCKATLKCPRCNINLVYHYKDKELSCHYCNFKMQAPKICPSCNSGYIKFSGAGTERIESELARIFASARIKRIEGQRDLNLAEADLFVSTSFIIKQPNLSFDCVGILDIDNSLNRIDFRASEKTFATLTGLLCLAKKKLVIQTRLPQNHCFKALANGDVNMFYEEELKQRKQLNFPPFKHLALVKLRGRIDEKVKQASESLFARLGTDNNDKDVRVVAVTNGQPSKLRGNFYRQILLLSGNPKKICAFLKTRLKGFLHSGIIVTIDVDPL